MSYFILFSIGPVQSFISQARKTHDLYAGSRLLSDLIMAAIKVVGEGNLIFPKIGPAMPNRFLAKVPDDINDYKDFGLKVETVVRNEWKKIADNLINNQIIKGEKKPDGYDQQIENFLEVYWCIEPVDNNQDYFKVYELLEKELSVIKNVRTFSQYTWQNGTIGERGRKCNLDGQRNVQFYRPGIGRVVSEKNSPLYSSDNGVYISSNFGNEVLQPGEGLSAVSFVKRKYKYDEIGSFKSTVEIALLDALADLEKDTCGNILLKEYKEHLFSSFNPQLFYEDSLTDSYLSKQGIKLKGGCTLNIVKEKRKALENLTPFKFQKYYAILIFDGDEMGKWWSGENLKDNSQLQNFQMKLAECLSAFAVETKKLLDRSGGQTVYAGGDDFLGFVNINHLFPVLKDLRSLFTQNVSKKISTYTDKEITFSTGICVAHHKEPLALVLQEARKAESLAKNVDGKDAFAISVIKGSGESHITALPFIENASNVSLIEQVIISLVKEEFSNNYIKNLRSEFGRLLEFSKPVQFEEMFRSELYRLLMRSILLKADLPEKKKCAEQMQKNLMELFGLGTTDNFFNMLSIIDFFQRVIDSPKLIMNPEI